ncbi:hypothetical protein [uncultured Corynebacterium sp.]|uniref:hypothetical protein n=1 Tax=uncultured Corynebacterium sp. TaxID=159447 RepID=UPI0025D04E1E|nr:hypothetical protein [uncultured Corynebacterium sp.]
MSEKLTVAELLARNGRETSSADTGRRRRRHRNLEKGGVSVAELTGSIPVVQTEDDADTPTKSTAESASEGRPTAPKPEQEQRSVSRTPERPEEKTGQLAATKDAEAKPAEVKSAEAKPAEVKSAEAKPAEVKSDEPQGSEPAQVRTPEATEPAATKSEPAQPVKAEQTAPADKAAKSTFGDVARGKVAEKPEAEPQGGATKVAEVDAAEKADAQPEVTADTADDSPVTSDEHAQFAELEESLEDGEVVEYEDDTISWPMMILQAILAIAVGVGVFFGFSLVWAKAPAVLALVLAIAVTLLLVGLVHALLRHRDKLLMILAAIVGLVLTIGPRLVQGL